jgi:hypothetical protein
LERLIIYTDGKNVNNTKVFIDGKIFFGIQKINFSVSAGQILGKCSMDFIPFQFDNVETIEEFDYDKALEDWGNVLEIKSGKLIVFEDDNNTICIEKDDSISASTSVFLNGKPINLLQKFEFSAEVNKPNGINIKMQQMKLNKKNEIALNRLKKPVIRNISIEDLPEYKKSNRF